MSAAEFDADAVVDARDCIVGRVASQVAERALDGERIAVVNAERAVVTGDAEDVTSVYRKRVEVGSDRGPYYPKRPDRIFKRAVRGMLPHKTRRGREAFENVRVYVENPYEGAGGVTEGDASAAEGDDEDAETEGADADVAEAEVLAGTSLDRLSNIKFVSLGEISEDLGANVTW